MTTLRILLPPEKTKVEFRMDLDLRIYYARPGYTPAANPQTQSRREAGESLYWSEVVDGFALGASLVRDVPPLHA